eukprot:TRINITY_DN2814_c0_g1_i1.p1 TRINITY_DN2814_c0_g1~~TRINITY_DN2814_c0_g1_i1.p1  ORF type:complete len:245 (-),score=68.11 TRINITY_DN2814_c0_g1_i1:63-797(-)
MFTNPFQMIKNGVRVTAQSQNGTRSITSFLREKQVSYLTRVLDRKRLVHGELQDQLQFSERVFNDALTEKARLANILFNEERTHRKTLEQAERKKNELAAAYVIEFANFNSKAKQLRDEIASQSASESALHSLEDQKLKVKAAERNVLEATQEAVALQGSGHIAALTKQFQEARDRQFAASKQFHEVKAQWISASKDMSRLHRLVNSVSTLEPQSEVPVSKVALLFGHVWSELAQFSLKLQQRN